MTEVHDLFGNEESEVGPQRLYLVCPSCRVMSFNLVAVVPQVGASLYEVHCAGCDEVVTSTVNPDGSHNTEFRWAKELPDTPPAGNITDLMGYANSISTGSPELARRRVQKHIDRWVDKDTLALLVGYNTDSESTMWMNFVTEEQRGWVLRKLDEIKDTVRGWDNGDKGNGS